MPETKIENIYKGQWLHLAWGGGRGSSGDELCVSFKEVGGGWYYDGPALRDALLEAFPLEAEKPEPEKPSVHDVVPGTVLGSAATNFRFTILPNNRYRDGYSEYDFDPKSTWASDYYTVIFDPRDAKALPSPLGIRVGDTVRRVRKDTRTDRGVTFIDEEIVEFEVNHISEYGDISPKYGHAYRPDDFTVVGREVPDRLPAGTIVRDVKHHDHLFLRTEDGHIFLHDGYTSRGGATGLDNDLREGYAEVIYLPEG